MLYLTNLNKDFGDKVIFDNINLNIYDGQRIAIIGNNGVGKTTLLNIISKQDKDYSGICKCDGHIEHLKQNSEIDLEQVYNVLGDKNLCKQFFMYLKKLNFNADIYDLETLSGGEKTKLAFALAYTNNPQILLLDEPTNHIDISGIEIITKSIQEFNGIVIIVSHDINFLNNTVNKIVEIKDGKIKEYEGNYNDYLAEKHKQELAQKREYEKHTKKVKEIQENIEKIKVFADKSERNVGRQGKGNESRYMPTKTKAMVHAKKMNKTVASRISKLEKQIDKAPEKLMEDREIKYRFDVNPLKVKTPIKFEDVSFGYPNKLIFDKINFEINSGDKIGIIGNNGVGKSTLTKLITNELQGFEGKILRAGSLNIAKMEQGVEGLDKNKTINELAKTKDMEYRNKYITNLINMNIDKSRLDTPIKYLSLGEKMRIKLNEIILSEANFIILDEPTNHLDIMNKDYMKKILNKFVGTILIISHDLEFIRSTCRNIYKIENHKLRIV